MNDEQIQFREEGQTKDEVTQTAITVGAAVPAATTIDAIFTSLWATRSADLAATPTYTWVSASPWPILAGTWPAATTPQGQACQLIARFEIRPVGPSTIAP
jgi:hypothetical protein